jgi:hypothetical protein
VAQGEGPEFKPRHCKTKTKTKKTRCLKLNFSYFSLGEFILPQVHPNSTCFSSKARTWAAIRLTAAQITWSKRGIQHVPYPLPSSRLLVIKRLLQPVIKGWRCSSGGSCTGLLLSCTGLRSVPQILLWAPHFFL